MKNKTITTTVELKDLSGMSVVARHTNDKKTVFFVNGYLASFHSPIYFSRVLATFGINLVSTARDCRHYIYKQDDNLFRVDVVRRGKKGMVVNVTMCEVV